MRLGTSSWIIESSLAENAEYLSSLVDDMELVLFDLPDGRSNLPDPAEQKRLRAISEQTGLSYTVHLPIDLRSDFRPDHPSIGMARRIIEICSTFQPHAYVAHLDGNGRTDDWEAWCQQAIFAAQVVAEHLPDPRLLALENLEGSPPDTIDRVLAQISETPLSRCVDVGHLWIDGHDPIPWLRAALPRLRVVHLHGLAFDPVRGRVCDHTSLIHMPTQKVRAVLDFLLAQQFDGVVSLEVFSQQEFLESKQLVEELLYPNQQILFRKHNQTTTMEK